MNTYASKVLRLIEQRDEDDAFVLRKGTRPKDYNINGVTAQSILQQLRDKGTRTRERLCRELHLDRPVLDAYAEALIAAGLVLPGCTGRGCETLALRASS